MLDEAIKTKESMLMVLHSPTANIVISLLKMKKKRDKLDVKMILLHCPMAKWP